MNRDYGMMGSLRSPSWVTVFRVGMALCVLCVECSYFRIFVDVDCGCDRDEGGGTRMRRSEGKVALGLWYIIQRRVKVKEKTDSSELLDIDQRIFISFKPLH